MDVNYVGEHLLPGQIGQFFVILAFGSAILSCISYFFSTQEPENSACRTMGRIGFWTNLLS